MTSKVFTQFENDLPVDPNKKYFIDDCYSVDTGLQEIHKYCLFPSKISLELQKYIQNENIINSKTNTHGYTPLMIAVINNVTESVEILLLKYKADVNIQDNDRWTALMIACFENKIKIVKLLLEYGADVNIQSSAGYTALMISCSDNIKITKLLLEYGADVNIQDKYNETAFSYLYLNRYNNNLKCIKLLLQYEDNINTNYIIDTVYTILSNINQSEKLRKINIDIRRLKKFDYNSILLYELKKCV